MTTPSGYSPLSTTPARRMTALEHLIAGHDDRTLDRLEAWRSAPLSFAAACGLTTLDSWQQEVLTTPSPRLLLNAARQSGKSTIVALLAAHHLVTRPRALVLVLAPGERQAGETFRKLTVALDAVGWPVPATRPGVLFCELANGSRALALPGSEQTVRGYSGVTLLVCDEAARVGQDLYLSIRPMLAVSGGRLVALSTPWGKRGWWWEAWRDTSPDAEPWERWEVPATRCARIEPEFLAQEKRVMGTHAYQSEYECQFLDARSSALRSEDVDAAIQNYEPWDFGRFLPTAPAALATSEREKASGGPREPEPGTAWNLPTIQPAAWPERRQLTPREEAELRARQFEAEVRRMWPGR